MRGQENVGLGIRGFYREDVPRVRWDHVGGYEIDLSGGVGVAVRVQVAFVGASPAEAGAFDLDAEEMAVGFDGQIVGSVVAPGAW